ncbi:MAG: hypothetical protein KAG56_01620 [Sulfurovaceae bacterium]|nr:hypothetical protein [Sulfurovaceae bacterium]
MKYIVTGLLLMAFTGCGSSGTEKKEVITEEEQKQRVVEETSPLNVQKSKTPPAIPKI